MCALGRKKVKSLQFCRYRNTTSLRWPLIQVGFSAHKCSCSTPCLCVCPFILVLHGWRARQGSCWLGPYVTQSGPTVGRLSRSPQYCRNDDKFLLVLIGPISITGVICELFCVCHRHRFTDMPPQPKWCFTHIVHGGKIRFLTNSLRQTKFFIFQTFESTDKFIVSTINVCEYVCVCVCVCFLVRAWPCVRHSKVLSFISKSSHP